MNNFGHTFGCMGKRYLEHFFIELRGGFPLSAFVVVHRTWLDDMEQGRLLHIDVPVGILEGA